MPKPKKKVESIGKVNRGTLMELANDPALKGFMIVCEWEEGKITTGWSEDLTNETMAYGLGCLTKDVEGKIY